MQGKMSQASTFIDSHCHYHPTISFPEFFSATSNNIKACIDNSSSCIAICLVEMEATDWFSELTSHAGTPSFDVQTKDENTLLVTVNEVEVSVFRARQINSLERIEVIIVGCAKEIPSGLPLDDYLKDYGKDYLVILPWGVGKWLGERGALVRQKINGNSMIVLGDNGGRPKVWTNIPAFGLAHKYNIPILAGSDPLPIKNHLFRSGAYGNIIEGKIDTCSAWISCVKNMNKTPKLYGSLSSTFRFLMDQIKLRLAKYI